MLALTGLTKRYDGFAFGPVDLTVADEVLAVLGPSGSGKTTLLSLVAGIVEADGGSITLDGRSLDGRPVEDRRTGLVFQDGALFPHMTARENVAYAASDPDRVAELAGLLAIEDALDRRPASLSGGERQRVALARTLAADPDAVLLDEPLSSLDAPIRRRLRDDLRALFDGLDVPVVYVTHDQRTATAVGDRVAVFRDGRIEQVGTPAAVVDRPQSRFVARFTGTENVFEARAAGRGEAGLGLRVDDLSVQTTDPDPAEGTVTACVRPSRVDLHGPDESPAAENVWSGTVDRWLNEGAEYRVVVALDDAPLSVVAGVRPGRFDRMDPRTGDPVRVAVPAAAVHVIR
jgi:molybdate/tungstate transport system ATP-binding protein